MTEDGTATENCSDTREQIGLALGVGRWIDARERDEG
tara:strand:+ start:489 stop:599 length:111 start_codon:yes stop_codon:yes gene_type:complete